MSFLALFVTVISKTTFDYGATVKKLTFGPKKFRSQYTCGEAKKKFWDKKSILNFSRQAHNGKVTTATHLLEFILTFFEFGCFFGRNIDIGSLFPTHDLKFGQ